MLDNLIREHHDVGLVRGGRDVSQVVRTEFIIRIEVGDELAPCLLQGGVLRGGAFVGRWKAYRVYAMVRVRPLAQTSAIRFSRAIDSDQEFPVNAALRSDRRRRRIETRKAPFQRQNDGELRNHNAP